MCVFAKLLNLTCLESLVYFGSIIIPIIILCATLIQKKITKPYPVILKHEEEKFFQNPENDTLDQFPSIDDEPVLFLSIVVPAFNEEIRLPKMFDEALEFLEQKSQKSYFTYEVILVSDGSTDSTVDVGIEYVKKYTSKKVRVMKLIENRGKGGAVRLGMLGARGKFILFADADGATKFSEYNKLESQITKLVSNWQEDAIVIGSRAHLEQQANAERSFFRKFLMHGFHFLVWIFAVKNIRDTQCGFKLFTRSAAKKIFKVLHVERWAFDVELLYIAQYMRMPIEEIAVCWQEIEGSKIIPFWSWLQMGKDLFLIWFRYLIGAWKIEKKYL